MSDRVSKARGARVRRWWRTLFVVGVNLVVLAGTAAALQFAADRGLPAETLLAGPAGDSLAVGLLSKIGVLLWALTAGACLLAAAALPRGPEHRRLRRLLAGVGTLTAVLAADALTEFHEGIAPTWLGINNELVLTVYAVVALALVFIYRDLVWRLPLRGALLLAGAVFAMSIGNDVFEVLLPSTVAIGEDVAELLAIVNWALCWSVAAFVAIRNAAATSGRAGCGG